MVAGMMLNLRDDYNPTTKTFIQTTPTYLSFQIVIMLWNINGFTSGLSETFVRMITYFGVKFKMTVTSFGYPIYFFWAQTNLGSVKNFDVFTFVRYLRDQ